MPQVYSLVTARLLLFAALFVVGLARDFYISPGSENGAASGDTFTGLQEAKDAVREAIAQGLSEDITIHVADGTYYLNSTLNFTAQDSGPNGHTVSWKATGSRAIISGGIHVTGWTENSTNGIWHASVPKGTQSRNLYVNGWAAQYARRWLNRKSFQVTNTSLTWTDPTYDWLMTTPGIANGEIRSLHSFTDHYQPIKGVGNRELIMAQLSWYNDARPDGWDNMLKPYANFGFWVQNALALLDSGGQYYLDSESGIVYYKPLEGEDMTSADTYLGLLEAIVSVSGTYDEPTHDITFEGFNFAHSTWMRVSTYGYVDQQTGGYIGENVSYPEFEAARSHWYLIPGAIQVSAAKNIHFIGGSYTQLGAGGVGIGNDPTAHVSGVGYGVQNVSVNKAYFTQVMGNGITAGGINIPAHHPNDTRMITSNVHLTENIFYNTSSLFSSTVPILFTYVQYSSIENNDISYIPYSGICHGYGWGMNDAGGSDIYVGLGTYKYQPIFETPTTSQNNLVKGNLIHGFGFSHTDLGAIYSVSKSPDTYIVENYAENSTWYGVYTDEGSNSLIIKNNTFMPQGGQGYGWYNPNQGSGVKLFPGYHTANNTLVDNFGRYAPGRDFTNAPNATGIMNNTFLRNFVVDGLLDVTAQGQRVAFRSGIPPASRGSRPVSNPSLSNIFAGLLFPDSDQQDLQLDVWNFDDADFVDVSIQLSTSSDVTATPVDVPQQIPADSHEIATWHLDTRGCTPAFISAHITYTNAQTKETKTTTVNGTMPSQSKLDKSWSFTSTWPATAGQLCDGTVGIRSGGRETNGTYDDWAVLSQAGVIGKTGAVSAEVLSMDIVNPQSRAGVVVRDSFETKSPSNDASHVNATGYAAVYVNGNGTVSFFWDSIGGGYLTNWTTTAAVGTPPYRVRLDVSDNTFSGRYATLSGSWTSIGKAVAIPRNSTPSDAGVIVNSHASFRDTTAIFDSIKFTKGCNRTST